ncbi:hypothetical protein OIV83_000702 [Microbotryomycetes sp. JL201]|nr:hypothetical protein OIV83_000702 [Microbotryomycetes sp. JL201]
MEKYSKWRDPASGIAPLVVPLPPTAGESTPPIVKLIALPLAWSLGAVRTVLVAALLLIHAIIVQGALKLLLVAPALHQVVSGVLTAIHARLILLLLGFVYISADTVSLKRTGRSPPQSPFAPSKGELIIANSSSYIDVLYLAFRFNPTFLLPAAGTPGSVTGWKSVGMVQAILNSGKLPTRSETADSLEAALEKAPGPCVCTTSNNRGLLKFGSFSSATGSKTKPVRTFILAFKYPLPTSITPSATCPIPGAALSPISHMFALACSPAPTSLTVRRLHPSESPKLSTANRKEDWDAIADILAALGRFKRLNSIDFEAKRAFLAYKKSR